MKSRDWIWPVSIGAVIGGVGLFILQMVNHGQSG